MTFLFKKISVEDFIAIVGEEDADFEGTPDYYQTDAHITADYTKTPSEVMSIIVEALNDLSSGTDYIVYEIEDGSDTHTFAFMSV